MLILTRWKEQSIVIGDNVQIVVLSTQGNRVRFGLVAPKHITIQRMEKPKVPTRPPSHTLACAL